jgi:hypothetical protein
MILLKIFKKTKPKIKNYTVKLQRVGEDYPGYILGISAYSTDEAVDRAKKFLAENGWWSSFSTIEQRINLLTSVEVVENSDL